MIYPPRAQYGLSLGVTSHCYNRFVLRVNCFVAIYLLSFPCLITYNFMISRVLNLRLNHSWLAIPRLLQTYISQGGPKLARGDQFWLPKLVRPDRFWQQNWSGGTSFGKNFCQNGPAGPIIGGTDFGMTVPL